MYSNLILIIIWEGGPHAVVADVLDYNIVVDEFEHQLHNYVQFQINTPSLLTPLNYGLYSINIIIL